MNRKNKIEKREVCISVINKKIKQQTFEEYKQ